MPNTLSPACKHFTITAIVLSAIALLPQTTAAQNNGVPVMIGGEADLDACGSVGKVANLNPAGDNFLAVRTGPASKYKMIDKLHMGHHVSICDDKGNWIGIVYGANENQDCGVTSALTTRQAYKGSCKSGWVHQRYISGFAG